MKTKIILLLAVLSTFLIIKSFSQAPGIEWQNTIGGNDLDDLRSVIQTTDGGYLLGGFSYSGMSGDKTEDNLGIFSWTSDFWVIKLNSLGDIEWQNTIGGNSGEWLFSLIQTNDGGYLLGGWSSSEISGDKTEASIGWTDYWVTKLDASGNVTWQNTIGGSDPDYFSSMIKTTDGGYFLGGTSYSGISGDKTEACLGSWDYWVIKLDSTGNIIWQNTIGGSDYDALYSVIQTIDGGYLLGGSSWSGISGDKTEANLGENDYWILKLDEYGNIAWQNTIGGSDGEGVNSMIQTNDGGYLLGGTSYSDISGDKTEANLGWQDYWIVKLDASGNIIWQNTIGGSDGEEVNSVIQTIDGGYLLGGSSWSGISGDKTEANLGENDYWILKLDEYGNIVWQNTIGGNDYDALYSVIQTTDGGYLLGGWSETGINGDKTEASQGDADYWAVKIFREFGVGVSEFNNEKSQLSIFPNPTSGNVTIEVTSVSQSLSIKVFDIIYREVYSTEIKNISGTFTKTLDFSNLPMGMYMLKMKTSTTITTQPLIIQ